MSDKADQLKILTRALQQDRDVLRTWLTLDNRALQSDEHFEKSVSAGKQVVLAIEQNSMFAGYIASPQRIHVGSYGARLNSIAIAKILVGLVQSGHKPQTAIVGFNELLKNNSVKHLSIFALVGIKVDKKIAIGPGIYLSPPSKLHNSVFRDGIFRSVHPDEVITPTSSSMMPKCALVVEFEHDILEEIEKDKESTALNSFGNAFGKAYDAARRAIACVAISGDCVPEIVAEYGWIDSKFWPYTGFGHSYGVGYFGEGHWSNRSGSWSPPLARQLLKQSYKFSDWKVIELSIARLIRAKTLRDHADVAIDLGISIESMLNPAESKKKDPMAISELNFKIASRGAWLIGKNPEDRLKVYSILQGAYSARSAGAHSGIIHEEKTINAISEAEPLCRLIARELLKIGYFPDWKKLVVGLGAHVKTKN